MTFSSKCNQSEAKKNERTEECRGHGTAIGFVVGKYRTLINRCLLALLLHLEEEMRMAMKFRLRAVRKEVCRVE